MQFLDARVVEQIVDDPVAARDAALDARDRPLEIDAFVRGGLFHREQRVADRAQRIAQLMRHGRGELAERREALFAHQLALRGFELRGALLDAARELDLDSDLLRDVAARAAIAAEMAFGIEDRLAADGDMDDAAVGQRALEAEIVERPARRQIGVMLRPLLGGDAGFDRLVPRLAEIGVAGDLAGAATAREAAKRKFSSCSQNQSDVASAKSRKRASLSASDAAPPRPLRSCDDDKARRSARAAAITRKMPAPSQRLR